MPQASDDWILASWIPLRNCLGGGAVYIESAPAYTVPLLRNRLRGEIIMLYNVHARIRSQVHEAYVCETDLTDLCTSEPVVGYVKANNTLRLNNRILFVADSTWHRRLLKLEPMRRTRTKIRHRLKFVDVYCL